MFNQKVKMIAAVSAVGLVALSGCSKGSTTKPSDATATASTSAATTAQKQASERVASLGMGDAGTLLDLGIQPVLIAPLGQKGLDPWTKPLVKGNPAIVYNASRGFKAPLIEQITAANPQILVAVNNAVDSKALQELSKIGKVVTHPSQYHDWAVPWDVQIKAIAEGVGKANEADKLIQKVNDSFDKFKKEHPESATQKAAAIFPIKGKIMVFTGKEGRGQFVKMMGYKLPDSLVKGAQGGLQRVLSPENFKELDQLDTAFVIDYQGTSKAVEKDPAFTALNLFKNGKVHFLDQETGEAMSVPNSVTVPWALQRIDEKLKK